MEVTKFANYDEEFNYSISDATREDYWAQKAQNIDWMSPPNKILDSSNPPFYRWFPDATLNITVSCVDRWAKKTPDAPALIYEGTIVNKTEIWSYKRLLEEVELCAGVLKNFGIEKGDRVIIYMPMLNISICAMLACARVGAVHSVVFGGFAAKEFALRVIDTKCKLVFSASCGVEPHKNIDYRALIVQGLEIAESKIPTIYYERERMLLTD